MVKRYEIKCDCGRHMMVGGAIACSVCYAEARERRESPKVPIGYTHTEIEVAVTVDSVSRLIELLADNEEAADDFLDGTYCFVLICETLTDGSEKRSIRIRPVEED